MKIDYRKDLEKAARQMILIHRADTLIGLVLRTVVKSVKVKHAGMLIYDKKREEYVVKVSRGDAGFKVPSGFVKIRKDNPLIRYFVDKDLNLPKGNLLWEQACKLLKSPKLKRRANVKRFLNDLIANLSFYKAKVCVPGFFRDDLIGVLFLGDKINGKRLAAEELGFLSVLASDVVMAVKNAWLIEDLNEQLGINKRLLLQIVSALSSSIEAKDRYTIGHTERVVEYSLDIANHLTKSKELSDRVKFNEALKIAALLHDIGKIGIPENILNKPSFLSKDERAVIEEHPTIGVNILSHIDGFQEVLLGVKHHHERYDGNGYPCKLKGRQIPLIASIIGLADAFDAMTTDRPYRQAFSVDHAITEIIDNRGKQFSPRVVDAFLKTNIAKDKSILPQRL